MSARALYLESVAGVAGDMFTAAFLDAGLVDPSAVQAVPSQLGFQGVEVHISRVERAGARCTLVKVVPPEGAEGGRGTDGGHLVSPGHAHEADSKHDHGHHHHRPGHQHHHYTALVQRLEESSLPAGAREFALRVFRLLAEAEADAHGVPLEKVVFHEVGAVDSVVDVAMAGVCLEAVAPERVLASPVKLGRGTIVIEHGTHPVPPPASARLAQGMPVSPVPEAIARTDVELSTPTGLSILKALDPDFVEGWPAGTLEAQGSGTGALDLGAYPNVFRVALFRVGHEGGEDAVSFPATSSVPGIEDLPYETDRVVEIRCNLDDQAGERTAWVLERALEVGALDAWVEQILGKKGRPALCLVLLASPDDTARLTDFLLRQTTTFGVRFASWDRLKLARHFEVRDTEMGPLTFKVGRTLDGEVVKEKPEFEELKEIWEEDPGFRP